MRKHVPVTITRNQLIELLMMQKRGLASYIRDRATAILKDAEGVPIEEIASDMLSKEYTAGTIKKWIRLFKSEGVEGLKRKEKSL